MVRDAVGRAASAAASSAAIASAVVRDGLDWVTVDVVWTALGTEVAATTAVVDVRTTDSAADSSESSAVSDSSLMVPSWSVGVSAAESAVSSSR